MSRRTYTIGSAGKPLRLTKPKHKKTTVYVPLGSPVIDIVVDRAGAQGHKAPTIVADLGLYYGVLKNVMAELWEIFGADEVSAMLQVFQYPQVNYANLWVWLDGGFVKMLTDEFTQTDVCEQFEVEAEKVLHKVSSLSQLQLLGLIDFTIIWWRTYAKPEQAKKMIQPFTGEEVGNEYQGSEGGQ